MPPSLQLRFGNALLRLIDADGGLKKTLEYVHESKMLRAQWEPRETGPMVVANTETWDEPTGVALSTEEQEQVRDGLWELAKQAGARALLEDLGHLRYVGFAAPVRWSLTTGFLVSIFDWNEIHYMELGHVLVFRCLQIDRAKGTAVVDVPVARKPPCWSYPSGESIAPARFQQILSRLVAHKKDDLWIGHGPLAITLWDDRKELAKLEKAAAADPTTPNVHNKAGWLLFRQLPEEDRDLPRAEQHFRAALTSCPDETAPLFNLADLLCARGQLDEAHRLVEARVVAQPSAPADRKLQAQLANWLAWYEREQRHDTPKSLQHADRAITLWPGLGSAYLHLGLALEAAGAPRYPEAWRAYKQGLDLGSHDDVLLWCRLASLARAWGLVRRALSLFRRAAFAAERSDSAPQRLAEMEAAIADLERQARARGLVVPAREQERRWFSRVDRTLYQPPEGSWKQFRDSVLATAGSLSPADRRHLDSPPCASNEWLSQPLQSSVHPWAELLIYPRLLARDEPLPLSLASLASPAQTPGVPGSLQRSPCLSESHLFLPSPVLVALADCDWNAATGIARALVQANDFQSWSQLLDLSCQLEAAAEEAAMFGQPDTARDFCDVLIAVFRWRASWGTAGAEGMAWTGKARRIQELRARIP